MAADQLVRTPHDELPDRNSETIQRESRVDFERVDFDSRMVKLESALDLGTARVNFSLAQDGARTMTQPPL